jgi:DNA-binding ferritin-like protein (Dps family)
MRIEYLSSLISKSEEEIDNQRREIRTIESMVTLLQHSDYWIEYLQKCFTLKNKIIWKNKSQSNKELVKLTEPRVQDIYFKERKEKLRSLIKQVDRDTLSNIEFFLLFHWIKTEWNDIEDINFYPEFSLIENFKNEERTYLDSSWYEFNHINFSIIWDSISILPRNYNWQFDWKKLHAYEKAQQIIASYIYLKYWELFNELSIIDDIDELYENATQYTIKQRYPIAIDIKAFLDNIPIELKQNRSIYIASNHKNIFDALVFNSWEKAEMPQYIRLNDDYGRLSFNYLLQHIWDNCNNLSYVHTSDLYALRELLSKKRKKLIYEKETISLNGDTIYIFITDGLDYYWWNWVNLEKERTKVYKRIQKLC